MQEYQLHELPVQGDFNSKLQRRWEGRGRLNSVGVRPLTEWFNQKIVQTAYANANIGTITERIETDTSVLVNQEESESYERLTADLSSDGVDVDTLTDSLISSATLYRHLKQCLGAESSKPSPKSVNQATDVTDTIEDIVGSQISKALSRLENTGTVADAAGAEYDIELVLHCPEDGCYTTARLQTAENRGYVCEQHGKSDTGASGQGCAQ